MLGAWGLWALSSCDTGPWFIQRTTPSGRLIQSVRECWGPILTRILTGGALVFDKSMKDLNGSQLVSRISSSYQIWKYKISFNCLSCPEY
jgi:hypothetical protein